MSQLKMLSDYFGYTFSPNVEVGVFNYQNVWVNVKRGGACETHHKIHLGNKGFYIWCDRTTYYLHVFEDQEEG